MADSNYNSNNNRNNNTYGQGNSDVRLGQDQGYNDYQKRADSNYNSNMDRDSQKEGSRTSNMGMGRSGVDNQSFGYGTNYGSSRSTSYGSGMDRGRSYGSSELANSAFGSTNTGGHAGKGPKGYQRSDDRIKEDVSEELYHHHEIDASQIEVDVKEGIITLKGHVETRAIKRLAEDSVQNLSGVKDVRNELSIDQSLFQQAKEFFTGESDMTKFSAKGDTTSKSGSRH